MAPLVEGSVCVMCGAPADIQTTSIVRPLSVRGAEFMFRELGQTDNAEGTLCACVSCTSKMGNTWANMVEREPQKEPN